MNPVEWPSSSGASYHGRMYNDSARPMDRMAVLLAAILFSTGGAAVKLCSLSAFQIASFRSGIAAVVLVLLLPAARKSWDWRTLIVGLAYAVTMVLYVLANTTTTAANTIFLQATAPMYILFLGPLLLGERRKRYDILFMVAVMFGCFLILTASQNAVETAPQPALGNLLAACAGLSWALTIVGIRWLGRSSDTNAAPAAVTAGNLLAFFFCLPMAFPVRHSTTTDWVAILFLGIVQIGIAYVFLTRGMRRVPAFDASLLLLAEPVLNPLWAFLVHHETCPPATVIGGAVVLGATIVKTRLDMRMTRNATD